VGSGNWFELPPFGTLRVCVRRFDFSAPTPAQAEAAARVLATIRQGLEFGDRGILTLVANLDAALNGFDSGQLGETFGSIDGHDVPGGFGRATGYDPGYEARVRYLVTSLELAFRQGILQVEEIVPDSSQPTVSVVVPRGTGPARARSRG